MKVDALTASAPNPAKTETTGEFSTLGNGNFLQTVFGEATTARPSALLQALTQRGARS